MLYDSDDDSDSEVYDTADEDSNGASPTQLHPFPTIPRLTRRLCAAEDWYQNDYPDEESSDHNDGSEGSGERRPRVVLHNALH